MNKKIILTLILLILIIVTAYEKNGSLIKDTDFLTGSELITLVEATMRQEPKEKDEIRIIKVEIVASFEEAGKQIVLANIYQMGFIAKDGIFLSSSGAMFPVEIRYEKKNEIPAEPLIIYSSDGSEFLSSVKKMSRNNENWYKRLLESQNSYHRIYNDIIQRLREETHRKNMKGYVHDKDKIPNYNENVLFFENMQNEPKGNIAVVKKSQYYKAKDEIGKVNWPHYKGLLFNKATGIAVESIFDEFPE